MRLLAAVRELVPPEVRVQVAELARRLLLLVRAIVDWWLARLDGAEPLGASAPAPVEDIPIS